MESGQYEEENTDTQEMIEDLLIRMLTREYLDVGISVVFHFISSAYNIIK